MNVSISIVLDSAGFIKKELKTFGDLTELDFYTVMLQNSDCIRELFKGEIGRYLEQNKNYLNKVSNNYQGRICITYYDKQGNVRFFPILYKKDIDILKRKDNLERISISLEDDKVLEQIFSRKKYLLTRRELELLGYYLINKSIGLKNAFINTFINRISNDKNWYLYMRSLLNVCGLLEKNHNHRMNILEENSEGKKYRK